MTRGLLPIIGMFAVLAPALAQAQTNLDQGKSAAQIFASDCAECHKSQSGLAKGRNSEALTEFLREHYTTSRNQAAALAAFVLGVRGPKPAPDRANASVEEAKPEIEAFEASGAPTRKA